MRFRRSCEEQMKIELRLKIVIDKKYFYTVERKELEIVSYNNLIFECESMRYEFLNSLIMKDFISLNIDEAGIRSVNKRVIDEIRVEIYRDEKRVSLKSLEKELRR